MNSKIVSEDSILKKWIPAIVNLEVVSKDGVQDEIHASGSAIFIKYNNKNYLITAKHVFRNYLDSNSNHMATTIYLIDNIAGSANKTYDLTWIPFLEGMNFFEASADEEDIAILRIISVSFNTTLLGRGYIPISIDDIDTVWQPDKKQPVYVIGYPADISNWHKPPDTTKRKLWFGESNLLSIPVVTKGLITDELIDRYFFFANVSFNHGNSGGPIISNNKLIGIASRYDPIVKNIPSLKDMRQYYFLNNLFIKSYLILPLLKRLESRLKIALPNH